MLEFERGHQIICSRHMKRGLQPLKALISTRIILDMSKKDAEANGC
jgi:hypothetical protein